MSDICVILGNGPSLKGFDFTRLGQVHSLGMNAAYRYWDEINWYPNYYACLDDQLIISHHDEIYRLWKEGNITQFFVHGSFFDFHPDCICTPEFTSLDQVLPHWYRNRAKKQGWPDLTGHSAFRTTDTTKVTTGAFATRFAAYMGHDTLALMGIDLKYVEILPEAEKADGVKLVMKETPKENPNYFFDSYQQAGDKYNIPNPDVHGNELHIQSFRLITHDFGEFGQRTKIYNTNPNSLLEDEQVFPLRLIGDVLIPHKLGAVVVPTTQFEIDAVLANFDIWAMPEFAPLSVTDPDNRCALVFMFNNDQSSQYEASIRARFEDTGMDRYFSFLKFEYLELEGDDDKYERDYSKKVGDQGYKSGPNNQFFLTMQRSRDLGRYVFQMETDCVPLRRGWLTRLRRVCAKEPDFWILGSLYHGVETLSPSFKDHLNGNAIYAGGDPGFQNFLDTFWEPRTRAMVAGVDKRLAYDCILEKVFIEQKDSDPEVAQLLADHGDKFRATEYVLNISGKRDLEELSPSYQRDLLTKFPDAYVLHNRTAQKWVASEAETAGKAREARANAVQPIDHPRLLIIDMTPMGNGTATGEVKSNLLQGWPADRLLQVASPSEDVLSLVRPNAAGGYDNAKTAEAEVAAAIETFQPEMILYRPLADRVLLHRFAMQTIDQYSVPLVTWIMDDWPARLFAEDKLRFAPLDRDLRDLLKRSALRLSICDAMSRAFAKRYGHPFVAYANGVDPAIWQTAKTHKPGKLVLRYAGGLAPDMNAQSVQRIAQAVEELKREGIDLQFEINTQSWWKDQSGHLFDGLKATKLTTHRRSFDDYTKWLREADALLIAYNFDHASLRYVMYSMANKLPECLASGAALLVHGPKGVATIDYVAETGTAQVVNQPDKAAVKKALRALADPKNRQSLADAARKMVFDRHSLPDLARNLARELESARIQHAGPDFNLFFFGDGAATAKTAKNPEQMAECLSEDGTGLIVFDDPADMLAEVMAGNGNPSDALALWDDNAAAALKVYKSARSRLRIIDRSRMAAAPKAFRAMIREMVPGCSLPAELRLKVARPDPLLFTVADRYVRQSSRTSDLMAELRASGLRPDGVPAQEAPDLAAALSSYHVLAGQGQELSDKSREAVALFAETTHLREERASLKAQLEAATTRVGALTSETGLKQQQIVQLQATSETYFKEAEASRTQGVERQAELDGLREERDALVRHRDELIGELDKIYRSKSWKVTEPLRGMRRVVTPGQTEGSEG